MSNTYRTELDNLGSLEIPECSLYGIHTARAIANFPITKRTVHPELIKAYGTVKLACASINKRLGYWDDNNKSDAIIAACRDMSSGLANDQILVDALQGGAGTSLNMNINEVIANLALTKCKKDIGDYSYISPLDDINMHQSTNDTYPTALRLAAINLLRKLEQELVSLQEAFQEKEKEFADVVKVGRTQMQDAVLTTLGREMGAYAECFNRDRWRVYKCEERLRVINLGGTAIGTGIAAPRQFIFQATDELRELTDIGFARAENLIEATQNNDVFVEVSGILKASATSLIKVCNDLRFMSSGPEAGINEISLPAVQAGSSIMPGKVNPVIPEAAIQAAMLVCGNDQIIASACSSGNLELNPFLPLVADKLLESLSVLCSAIKILREKCITGIEAMKENCEAHVAGSTATATALLVKLSYEQCAEIAEIARKDNKSIKEVVLEKNLLSEEEFNELITPEAVCRLGK